MWLYLGVIVLFIDAFANGDREAFKTGNGGSK